MLNLNKSQIEFLKSQNISEKMIFNAKGLKKSEYKGIMKLKRKIIAYNVTPCRENGHTLRTRSGHCVQCNTTRIGFQKRSDKIGFGSSLKLG